MKKEEWGKNEWYLTIAYLIFFFPIGFAALLRRYTGKRVWK